MELIDEKMRKEILQHHPVENHTRLLKQILAFNDTMEKHQLRYQYSKDFRDAVDLFLGDFLKGKFLGE